MLSNFQVEYGRDPEGNKDLIRVPIRYGDASRQAQTILQNNSANSLPSTPMMSFYITGMDYDRGRIQEPYYINKMQVRQRTYDSNTDSYETTQGNAFTIERMMPVPYKMTINLDIWTSNTNQKMQLFEQLAVLFNPSLEIQSTDNYIDWTSLSVVDLDRVQWSSRSIPMGTENPIDIMTMTFGIPIWISSPVKVRKLGVVERIVASIYDSQGDPLNAITNNDLLLGTRVKITPYNYQVLLLDGQLQILNNNAVISNSVQSLAPFNFPVIEDPQIVWPAAIAAYGVLRPGISYITLSNPWEPDTEIVGTISVNPADDRLLIYNIDPDTAPANTLAPVDAVINPLLSAPGDGLDSSIIGQRYLLTESTGNRSNTSNPLAWRGINNQPLYAEANDIIEFDGIKWRVVFDSVYRQQDIQYVTNIMTGLQYRWSETAWTKSIDGLYSGGSWNLVL